VATFSGPIPAPEDLARYGQLDPSFPERIFTMAERNQEHRLAMESKILAMESAQNSHVLAWRIRAQWMSFAFSTTAILAGTVLLALGHDLSGLTALIAAVASLVAAGLWGVLRPRGKSK
jgi:uncharacterized membrane protein